MLPPLPKREIRLPAGAVGGVIDCFPFCAKCLCEDGEVPGRWLQPKEAGDLECFGCHRPLRGEFARDVSASQETMARGALGRHIACRPGSTRNEKTHPEMTASPAPAEDVTFVVPGELIVTNRVQFRNMVLDAMRGGNVNIVLDFAQNTYTDSTGLAVLVTLNQETKKVGGTCTLVNVGERLRDLLRHTKLDTALAIRDSASELGKP